MRRQWLVSLVASFTMAVWAVHIQSTGTTEATAGGGLAALVPTDPLPSACDPFGSLSTSNRPVDSSCRSWRRTGIRRHIGGILGKARLLSCPRCGRDTQLPLTCPEPRALDSNERRMTSSVMPQVARNVLTSGRSSRQWFVATSRLSIRPTSTVVLSSLEICGPRARRSIAIDLWLLLNGTSLASFESDMAEIALPSTYNEPTVMWRMTHRDGRWGQAVIDPLTSGARAQWFVNGHPLAICDFADWTSAMAWTDRLRAQQWTVGWRLSEDLPENPAARSGC